MLLPLPLGVEFACVLSGSVYKVVRCANCKGMFAYQMARSAMGTGESVFFLNNEAAQERALNEAQRKLVHALNSECDAVPCLHCGLYQESMMPVLRKNHRRWMFTTATLLTIPIMILGLMTYLNLVSTEQNVRDATIYFAAAMMLVFFAGGLILFRKFLADLQELDSGTLASRMRIASERTMTIESFNEMMGEKVTDWKPLPVTVPITRGHPPKERRTV
jgi:cation transport ATPase